VRLEIDVAGLPAQALFDAVTAGRLPGATLEARGTVVLDVPLRDAARFRYAGERLAASGRLRRFEWSIEPFRASGTAEEASVAGLRLTTRGIERPGAAPSPILDHLTGVGRRAPGRSCSRRRSRASG